MRIRDRNRTRRVTRLAIPPTARRGREYFSRRLDERRQGERLPAQRMLVDAHEPQLLAYGVYVGDEGGAVTVIAIHPDSSSLELHLEIGSPAFRKFIGLIDLRTIEVYGRPGNKVLEQPQLKVEMLGEHGSVIIHEQDAGFTKFVSALT